MNPMEEHRTYTAFSGNRCIVSGDLKTTILGVKDRLEAEAAPILIFDDQTGGQVDFDFRGTPDEVLARLPSHPLFAADLSPQPRPSGPGRPKLGVVSREVSLLPRHWAWLEQQPKGMSAALRRLVEDARKREPDRERARRARDAVGKFMWAMAGNLPGFEEASRALYAGDEGRFETLIRDWPADIRTYLMRRLGDRVAVG